MKVLLSILILAIFVSFDSDAKQEPSNIIKYKTIGDISLALHIFNPVYDNGPNGYGYSRVQDYWEEFCETLLETDKFLTSLGFLSGEQTLKKRTLTNWNLL